MQVRRIIFVEHGFAVFFDGGIYHRLDELSQASAGKDLAAAAVEYFALIVHHLVVFEQAFSCLEVSLFDFFLGLFDALADAGMIDRLALFPADPRRGP